MNVIPSYRFVGSQWAWPKVMVLKLIQPILQIFQMKLQVFISMTTWFLKDIITNVGNNSVRKMCVGREFPNRENQGLRKSRCQTAYKSAISFFSSSTCLFEFPEIFLEFSELLAPKESSLIPSSSLSIFSAIYNSPYHGQQFFHKMSPFFFLLFAVHVAPASASVFDRLSLTLIKNS